MRARSRLSLIASFISPRCLMLIIVAIVTVSGMAAFGRPWSKSLTLTDASRSQFSQGPVANSARVGDQLETELITIVSAGFEPTELTRPAGRFLLEVDNRSGIEEVELRLDRQEGGREKSARVRSTAPEWQSALDLHPGVYILSEVNHSSWT